MRHARAPFRIAAFLTAVTVLACAGGEKADTPDSSASAAAAAPPPPESFMMVADDGSSWTGEISPTGIVYRPKRGDSLVFDYKAPTVNGGISDYDVLMTGKDTMRISITMATTPCTAGGAQYTHLANLWLTGKHAGRELNTQVKGCANKK